MRFLSVLSLLVAVLGCGGPLRHLHPLSGDDFTLFPGERKPPPPITCAGLAKERFACFTSEFEERSRQLEAAGAFAVVTPDGELRTIVRSDALNQGVDIGEDTRFPIGSVTKMFLAAAVVSLSLKGAVDLQVPIARYVPELSSEVGPGRSTLHQLLTHTSGLGNPPQCEKAQNDLPDVLTAHARTPLYAPPGAVFNYSNLGYGFVALVLERVTSAPFERVVSEHVLSPAGIPGGSFGLNGVAVRGHAPDGVALTPRCRAMWPSGGLVLSVRELAQWGRALARPSTFPLGRPLWDLLTGAHVPRSDRPGAAYGYGVMRFEHGGLVFFSHAGRLENFSAFVAWQPEREVAVAGLVNRTEMLVVMAGWRAMSTFLSVPADWQPEPGPAHPLSAYAGTYVDDAGTLGRLRVSLEGGQLVIDYLDAVPPLLPPNFNFVFERGAARARYVVTAVGVGERRGD